MPPKPPKTLFEDEHILAASKPRGLLTVGSKPGQKNLLDQLKKHYQKKNIRLRPINRLDRGTSGIVLFAKTKECFEKAVTENKRKPDTDTADNKTEPETETSPDTKTSTDMNIAAPDTKTSAPHPLNPTTKTYIALIKGIPKRNSGSITFPLPSRQDKRRMLKAKTKYRVMSSVQFTDGSLSLIEARLSAGRFHQIRRHLTKIHHPLLMDREYMDRKDYKYWQHLIPLRHFFLHAHKITFRHFITGEEITIEDRLPKEFKKTLKLFNLKSPELK